jgi:hypothetical protein
MYDQYAYGRLICLFPIVYILMYLNYYFFLTAG